MPGQTRLHRQMADALDSSLVGKYSRAMAALTT